MICSTYIPCYNGFSYNGNNWTNYECDWEKLFCRISTISMAKLAPYINRMLDNLQNSELKILVVALLGICTIQGAWLKGTFWGDGYSVAQGFFYLYFRCIFTQTKPENIVKKRYRYFLSYPQLHFV